MGVRKAAREALEATLAEHLPKDASFACIDNLSLEERGKLTYDDVFWMQLRDKALNGDMKAMQEVLDRRFGKSPQHIFQETRNITYVDFLSSIERQEARDLQITTTMPQVIDSDSSEDRGTSGDDLLDDLGLL